ncbi:phosphotransferase [Pseudoalteromonas sp. MMG012]|uniref:aminoglycoside phosphotransferase family protein n=1 Tax=Pseudoalteromonas sp. MMG012 TaxID=2822686 RepID=UPI001B3A5CDE|nr:phosphotransferase [Pseudoalteromonas sp. MMG012]MBQ4849142.1 phosphotransferase [Pseudoalteromonas sp. MMG012]
MTNNKERQTYIEQFLVGFFNDEAYRCEVVTADASFRRYLRVYHGEKSYILMDSEPNKVDNQPFVDLNANFALAGIKVPKILAQNMPHGILLLEDLGAEHLADHISDPSRLEHYMAILDILPSIATVTKSTSMKPYDDGFITQELEIFENWLLNSWLDYELEGTVKERWQETKLSLVSSIVEQPKVTMHRDFHSRNIMRHDHQWAVIDYQDAVQGPITYDAVSLLRDCYFKLPADDFLILQKYSYKTLKKAQLLGEMTYLEYQYYFDLTGLQRHLKAAGIFARLLLRDNKAGYLDNIIPTLQYVVEVAKRHDNYQWLATWLVSEIIPLINSQLNKFK